MSPIGKFHRSDSESDTEMNNPGFYWNTLWFSVGEIVEVSNDRKQWFRARVVCIEDDYPVTADESGHTRFSWLNMRKRSTFDLQPPQSFVDWVHDNGYVIDSDEHGYPVDGDSEWHAKRIWNAVHRCK